MRDFLDNIRYRFSSFMQGRYGMDNFGRFMLVVWLILYVLRMFLKHGGGILGFISTLLLAYALVRALSRNIPGRYAENQKYLKQRNKVLDYFKNFSFDKVKRDAQQMKDYHIYKCPKCAQKIRIPRGKGHIMVKCPKCGFEFHKKS